MADDNSVHVVIDFFGDSSYSRIEDYVTHVVGKTPGILTVFSANSKNKGVQTLNPLTEKGALPAGANQASGIQEQWAIEKVIGFHTGNFENTTEDRAIEALERGFETLITDAKAFAVEKGMTQITLVLPYVDLNNTKYYRGAFLQYLPGDQSEKMATSVRINAKFADYVENMELESAITIKQPRPQLFTAFRKGCFTENNVFRPNYKQFNVITFFPSLQKEHTGNAVVDTRPAGGGKSRSGSPAQFNVIDQTCIDALSIEKVKSWVTGDMERIIIKTGQVQLKEMTQRKFTIAEMKKTNMLCTFARGQFNTRFKAEFWNCVVGVLLVIPRTPAYTFSQASAIVFLMLSASTRNDCQQMFTDHLTRLATRQFGSQCAFTDMAMPTF